MQARGQILRASSRVGRPMVVSSAFRGAFRSGEREALRSCNVPIRDFDAPKPCPYDASAGAVTACGLLMLYRLLRPTDPRTAEQYLTNSFKLVDDLMRECRTGKATLEGDKVIWGEGAWETILEVSWTG